ncbi:MAG: glycosyl transferase [Chloroflexi bacterium]|nr:MAG: glycosyl transferase [Chloroflexota bacterium]
MSSPCTVILLTYNEEANLERCLNSLKDFTDDIVVVDSFSTDRTLEICKQYGCRIYQNKFVNHAVQFNWALDHLPLDRPWILRMDADEVLPAQLKQELRELVRSCDPEITGIYLNRRMYFMNRWLKHGGIYPHHILRMFRRGMGRYEEKTEEHLVLAGGRAIYAEHDFLEDNRQNHLKYWLRKHDELSDGEIRDTLLETHDPKNDLPPALFGSKVQRTRWLKVHVYAKTPLFVRAFLYCVYRYVFRLGFLDGIPGLIFHVLQGFWYRFYVDARIYEIRSRWQSTTEEFRNI